MAKEPARRYARAKDLAEDLRSFLEGRPIKARPIGSFERVWRWANRNRTIAALLVSLVVVFLGGFAGVVLALIRSEHFRGVADEKRFEAVGQSQVAEARRKDAEKAKQLAEEQRKQAEANFDKAIATVDEYLTKVGNEKLLDVPGLAPLRRELLTSALTFYQRFLADRDGDPRLDPRIAAAYLHVAKIKDTIGPKEEATQAFNKAQDLYERLRTAKPDDRSVRAGLAETLHYKGLTQEAIVLAERLVEEEPTSLVYRRRLANSYNTHAIKQSSARQFSEAINTYQKCSLTSSSDCQGATG